MFRITIMRVEKERLAGSQAHSTSLPPTVGAFTVLSPAQTIPATITLNGASGTVQLSVSPSGSASIDQPTLNLTDGVPLAVATDDFARWPDLLRHGAADAQRQHDGERRETPRNSCHRFPRLPAATRIGAAPCGATLESRQ